MQDSLRNQLAQLLASIDQMIAEREETTLADGDLARLMLMAESLQGLYEMRESVEERLSGDRKVLERGRVEDGETHQQ